MRYVCTFELTIVIIIIIIIISLFIEGSLISAKDLFCLRALFGTTRIHSSTRMPSFFIVIFHDHKIADGKSEMNTSHGNE